MGITMSQPSNKSMVDELVDKHHYIMSPNVEGAFRAVDRAMYFNLEEGDTFDPYSETPWRDGNIHLSAPCIYAKAVEALDLQPGHSFLNLGSGTGYLNTIVGLIIGPHGVNHGIEYHSDVVEYAHERLKRFKQESFAIDKYDFAEPIFVHGDCVKLNPNARYDRVYLGAACMPELESFMKKLVKPAGGVLVMPLDCFLLRYIRITEVDWKVEKLMQVSFTLMIREPNRNEDSDNMIDMPLAQPKSLKELCRIHIRQHIRDKTNQENPNLLNSDNIEARKIRKARAERKIILKQEKEFRRRYNICPYVNENGVESNSTSHKTCRRWPCREFNDLGTTKVSSSDEDRIMTRSARRRFELSRLFNRFRSNPGSADNSVSGQLRERDNQIDSASDDSSSDNRGAGNYSGPVTRGEGCSRTRPFVSRLTRQQHNMREQAPSPARLGDPYRVARSAFPASRRADIRRIIDSSYRPVFMSSPSTASTNSDSSSSSSMRQNDDGDYNRRPILPDLPSLLRIRRRALSDLASRALLSSIFEPIPNDLDEIDVDDSDYEEESDDGDSFDDDFNDPDLSGLESFDDEEEDISDESEEEDNGDSQDEEDDNDDDDDDDDDNDNDDARSGESNSWQSFLETLNEDNNNPASSSNDAVAPAASSRSLRSNPAASLLVSSASSQMSRAHRSRHETNESSAGSLSIGKTVAVNRYHHHCHMQQQARTDRKRKRHSSSSSCSGASNTSSPSRRGRPSGRSISNTTKCCNRHEAARQDCGRVTTRRRCCYNTDEQTVTMMPATTDIAARGHGTSSLSSHRSGDSGDHSAAANSFEATSESHQQQHRQRGHQPPDAKIPNPGESSHRWTRLRSLISAKAKSDASSKQATTSSGPACPLDNNSNSSSSSSSSSSSNSSSSSGSSCDMFAMLKVSSLTKQRQSDCPVTETTNQQQQSQASELVESAPTRCKHHQQRQQHHHHHHHHCHSHSHAHHRHHRCCCSKCSRHRITASSSNQQSGSREIESMSSLSPPAATTAAAAASVAEATGVAPSCSSISSSAYRNCRNSGGLKIGHESKERQEKRRDQQKQQEGQEKRKSRQKKQRKVRSENECQRYHNHLSTYISQLPVPRVLQNYLNFDRGNV